MAQDRSLRVGIIGAGHISEFHLRALSRSPSARVVGVVDADRSRAEAVGARWKVPHAFSSTRELYEIGVDVVHILTPPSSHAALTLEALSNGAHAYVEKPLATSREDCDRIIAAAKATGLSVCVGHSFLRDPTWMQARHVIDSGCIGDPLSVQYVRSTNYPTYRGGPLPEMYREGGYPFRDMGVHGLYVIESLLGEITEAKSIVAATGRDPTLHCDEWTVALKCRCGQAVVNLSWNSRPHQHTITVYGTRGVLRADLYAMYVSVKRARRLPGHVTRVVNSIVEASQMAIGTFKGLAGFALGRVRQYHGLQHLVAEFHAELREGRPAPITPEQARTVVAWTESIASEADRVKSLHLASACTHPQAPTLVTGGTGLIGRRLVERLLQEGRRLRLLVRRIPTDQSLMNDPNVELIIGDLGDEEAVDRAVVGTKTIFHLGAAMSGSTEEFDRGTVVGTRNVVESALKHGVDNFIFVSSLGVLHALAEGVGAVITESWPIEPHPSRRGNYSRTKVEAEKIVRDAAENHALRAIILRPAEVLGDGPPRLTAGIALRVGRRLIVLGDGNSHVPMVYVGDLVDALLQAEDSDIRDGSIHHLVDPTEIPQNSLIERIRRSEDEPLRVVHVPRVIVRLAGFAGDVLSTLTRRQLPITSYRLLSACSTRRFDCDLAAKTLGWRPCVGVRTVLCGDTPPNRSIDEDSNSADGTTGLPDPSMRQAVISSSSPE